MKKKRKNITLQEALTEELKDPTFAFYFEHEKAISEIARMVRDARSRAGITQSVLARKAKTTQAVIARLESGSDQRIPSLSLLERVAHGLKARLLVKFEYNSAA
jgi:ribosome-binding protein aMBF1 (putative translation factor)